MGGCLDGGRSTLVSHPLSHTGALTGEQVSPQRDDFSDFVFKIQAFGNSMVKPTKSYWDGVPFAVYATGDGPTAGNPRRGIQHVQIRWNPN